MDLLQYDDLFDGAKPERKTGPILDAGEWVNSEARD
jgi:hypothetical protein